MFLLYSKDYFNRVTFIKLYKNLLDAQNELNNIIKNPKNADDVLITFIEVI